MTARSLLLLVWLGLQGSPALSGAELIRFDSRPGWENHRPILIAHRGGVITPQSPECSLAAIRLAAQAGYSLVELDVRMSRDRIPMVFHDRTLLKACGRPGATGDYTARELEAISYSSTDAKIVSLKTALKVCLEHRLGIMLDLKEGRDDAEFLEAIRQDLHQLGMTAATISFSGSSTARRVLDQILFTPTADEMTALRQGKQPDLSQRFWFGLPQDLPDELVSQLQASGARILPAINTFRYPADTHMQRAKADIQRLLRLGVDGFQLDSIYQELIPMPHRPSPKE